MNSKYLYDEANRIRKQWWWCENCKAYFRRYIETCPNCRADSITPIGTELSPDKPALMMMPGRDGWGRLYQDPNSYFGLILERIEP